MTGQTILMDVLNRWLSVVKLLLWVAIISIRHELSMRSEERHVPWYCTFSNYVTVGRRIPQTSNIPIGKLISVRIAYFVNLEI